MTKIPDNLRTLNDLLITEFITRIESGEATAAELNAARQLLKDNAVDFISLMERAANTPILSLAEALPEFEDPPYPTSAAE